MAETSANTLPRRVRDRPSFPGLALAALFLAASMFPSLMPRHWLFQGLVGGIVAAVGYGAGALGGRLWRRVTGREPSPRRSGLAWWLLAAATVVLLAVAWVLGVGWQRELHRLMEAPIPSAWGYAAAVPLAVMLGWALVLVGRTVGWAAHRLAVLLDRWLPRHVARLIGGALVVALLVGILDGIVVDAFFSAADETFRLSDELVDDRIPPPGDPLRSGSAESLVAWEDLGSQGRAFVAGGPSRDEIAAFAGAPAQAPIRVFAGLGSAETPRERAALVVAELERTGAFGRPVLVVATATGTGWVNPEAAAAVEHMWRGDTALASLQYSYLPSWLSFLVDSARAREAGAELFDAVHARWAALPEGQRPLLLVFGESLGADGSEAAFSGVADIRNRVDGALWVGPPNFSELWATFTERRDPGTPERLPSYDGGATVRFAGSPAHLPGIDAPWYHPRVLYLQHASDPVVWWSPRLVLRRPDWLAEPRGPDVHRWMRWYPLVTFLQLTADLSIATEVPPGHGHNYAGLVADGWAAIAPPPWWGPDDTDRLRDVLVDEWRRRER